MSLLESSGSVIGNSHIILFLFKMLGGGKRLADCKKEVDKKLTITF